jgi:glycosyltransferase involved in cell wall biosynthesis
MEPPATRLRVGIDAHALGQRQTGNERFVAGVVTELQRRDDCELVLFVTNAEAARGWVAPGTTARLLRPSHPLARVLGWFPYWARRDRLDAMLVQYVTSPFLPCPSVAVVHDVAFALFPEYYSRAERFWMPRAIPATMRRASAVVTVSEFSRDEIARLYGIDRERITVAYDGVDASFHAPPLVPAPVDRPYFLAVGNLQPRKNLLTLIRGFGELVRSDPTVPERLVIAGQRSHGAETVLEEARALERSGTVVFLGYVPDQQLVALLHGATAFCYPSIYEGFGLPVVEAMAAGTPVLASDIPVVREVAAGAALVVPPTDSRLWAEALGRIRTDATLRASLLRTAAVRVQRFTWEECAGAVLGAIREAVGRPPARDTPSYSRDRS